MSDQSDRSYAQKRRQKTTVASYTASDGVSLHQVGLIGLVRRKIREAYANFREATLGLPRQSLNMKEVKVALTHGWRI